MTQSNPKKYSIILNLRGEKLELTVEPRPGDFVKVIEGINHTRNCFLDRFRLDIFEQFHQKAIKNALIAKAQQKGKQDD